MCIRDRVMDEIKAVMKNTTEKNVEQVNWTKVWSKKYPVLGTYSEVVDVEKYGLSLIHIYFLYKVQWFLIYRYSNDY